MPPDDLIALIAHLSHDERVALLSRLRKEYPIHSLEREWNTTAEALLEAISRSSDLTRRGIRGILAEASFHANVLPELLRTGWQDVTPAGDAAFDAAVRDRLGTIRIQVKLQRRKLGEPMTGRDAPRKMDFSPACFVVETQKTRAGKRDGRETRPYRFGEFEILAVSLQPSSGNWESYLFTVASWLLPDPSDGALIYKYQPVPTASNDDWTDSIETCIQWVRAERPHTIRR